jgi:hypothetical protein
LANAPDHRYAALFSRPVEVIMLTRRVVTGVCALCLAIPAVAAASPATVPPKAKGLYGFAVTGPPNTVKAKGLYGAAVTGGPSVVKARGLYGAAVTRGTSAVRAKGLYGPAVTDSNATDGVRAQAAGASGRDGTNDWRTAAISEAAVLAALALGLALLLPDRRRAPRLGM